MSVHDGVRAMCDPVGRLHVADFAAHNDAAETRVAVEHAVDVCDAVRKRNGGQKSLNLNENDDVTRMKINMIKLAVLPLPQIRPLHPSYFGCTAH